MSREGSSQPFDFRTYVDCRNPTSAHHSQACLDFFAGVAQQIAEVFHPETVLEVGCGWGLLVEGLRAHRIKAFGVDPALPETLPESIRPYCWRGSLSEPLPQKYDLIVAIEALEDLSIEQAAAVVANLCNHTDDILFAASAFDFDEPARPGGLQAPEEWADLFARCGFYRDVDYEIAFTSPQTVRFRRLQGTLEQLIAAYEGKHWRLLQDFQARRQRSIQLENEITAQEHEIQRRIQNLENQRNDLQKQLNDIYNSNSWRLITRVQRLRERVVPLGSRREDALYAIFRAWRVLRREGLRGVWQRVASRASWKVQVRMQGLRFRLSGPAQAETIRVPAVPERPAIRPHQASVEIVVCIHNALDDVRRCLESVTRNTREPYRLVLVDDGSNAETRAFLDEFALQHTCTLLRNDQARGYTRAANQGLQQTTADFVVLLNSDTIVTPGWLDRLVACAESGERVGMVGPLSNTASWQSIPEIESAGDWAGNPLPEGVSVDQMGELVAQTSARLYPEMPFLNGFCLLIRRELMREIGYFDEENFGQGYGEENDYCIRARQAGWKLALADDAYIYHAQSRSYQHARRRQLSQQAGEILAKKYGQSLIDKGTAHLRKDRVFEGLRARSRQLFARHEAVQLGKARYAGRKVLFVLPVPNAGGGSNVVTLEGRAMKRMGVDVWLLNLRGHRASFEEAYPHLDLPVVYAEIGDIPRIALRYDAVIATFNPSVAWIAPALEQRNDLRAGYYVQDFEPLFYPPQSEGYRQAWDSYTLIPGAIRFAKTEWTCEQIRSQIGVSCQLVGPSFDVDLFMPRPREKEWPERPLRVGAMIRPGSLYRAPRLTMEILERLNRRYGPKVEIMLFGTEVDNPGFAELPHHFPWKLAGVIGPRKVASLLNELDIFVDFSSHQAMGMTAMEAMACGVAVIAPQEGGAATFARHQENCLLVDTTDDRACWEALVRLFEDYDLRARLQREALREMPQYFPERPALEILKALFGS